MDEAAMDDGRSGPEKDPARDKLVAVARRLEGALSDVYRGWVYVHEDDAEFLLLAIDSFLLGKSASLDRAFGLVRQRGRPKSGPESKTKMALVKAAIESGAKSWDKIAADPAVSKLVGTKGIDADGLRKFVNRHREKAERENMEEIAKDVVASMDRKDAEQRETKAAAEIHAKAKTK